MKIISKQLSPVLIKLQYYIKRDVPINAAITNVRTQGLGEKGLNIGVHFGSRTILITSIKVQKKQNNIHSKSVDLSPLRSISGNAPREELYILMAPQDSVLV